MRAASEWEEERESYVRAIVESDADKKLIVAGPGTGKTHTFKKIVQGTTGEKLVLTFIRNLVGDLTVRLGDQAEVYTFHGFCARLLYELRPNGLSASPTFYPPLVELVRSDLEWLGEEIERRDLEDAFHDLDEDTGLIPRYIRSGDYYDAVGYSDAVYRVLRHLESETEKVPRYDQVLVDEYQDFSRLEVTFIDALASVNRILIVGDDDQALYTFRRASWEYIRALAAAGGYERFELPFCSRCTFVMVDAARRVIEEATRQGHLRGRIEKRFESYEPLKREDSERYPRIFHAHCSVQTSKAPYMARYIAHSVARIPRNEVEEAHDQGFPTVLVVGPKQFANQMAKLLPELGVPVISKKKPGERVMLVDGYNLLARHSTSRLGWRIVLYLDPLPNLAEFLEKALVEGEELHALLPADYVSRHLNLAHLRARYQDGEKLPGAEISQLDELGLIEDQEAPFSAEKDLEVSEDPTIGGEAEAVGEEFLPKVVVTTLEGAKGLEAQHVFVVGLNEGHLPRRNSEPTDHEICCLIVALTRGRKTCHLMSCGRFGKDMIAESGFLSWLAGLLERVEIKKGYFD